MNLTDLDAIELAETLEWIAEFLTQTDPATITKFDTWADKPGAATDLISDLREWSHHLTTNPPT